MAGIITTPADFRYRPQRSSTAYAYALRECTSDARNYGAKNALVIPLYVETREGEGNILGFFHDGEPFESLAEVLEKGCTPNVTDQRGGALQGSGLAYTAAALVPPLHFPQLWVGSRVKRRGWVFGTGHPMPDNTWRVGDVSERFGKQIIEIMEDHMNEYTVFYGFRVKSPEAGGCFSSETQQSKEEARIYLKTDIPNLLGIIAPDALEGLTLHFCEKQIGFPYPGREGAKYRKYPSNIKSGFLHRRAISYQGYNERFMLENGSFEIQCEPFESQIGANCVAHVSKARVVISIFPGNKSKERVGNWFVNERSGEIDGGFSEGKMNEFGRPPAQKAALFVPWIYSNMLGKYGPETARGYMRFNTQATTLFQGATRLMNFLGCIYNERRGARKQAEPFVRIEIIIDEIDKLIDTTGGDSKVYDADAQLFLGEVQRRSDFTFDDERQGPHNLMKDACRAAAANTPQELKDLCEKYFKLDTGGYVEIFASSKKREKRPTVDPRMVRIFDLDSGGELFEEFEVEADSSHRIALFSIPEERFLGANEVGVSIEHSRGWKLDDLTNFANQFPGVKKSIKKVEENL